MKSAKPSAPAPAAKSNSPFFNKSGGQDFFHASNNEKAFFSEDKTQAFLQAKLTVGKPNDPYEKEADAVADQVVERLSGRDAAHAESNSTAGNAPATVQTKPLSHSITPLVQPKCASCEAEEEKKLQQKADCGATSEKQPVAEEPEEKNVQRKEAVTVQACSCEEEQKLPFKPAPHVMPKKKNKRYKKSQHLKAKKKLCKPALVKMNRSQCK